MQFNYYTLKRLSSELKKKLQNAHWEEAFSQEKDELIISFSIPKSSPFFIRCTLRSEFSCLSFPTEYHKSRKNVINLFTELNGLEVKSILQYENERAFSISFDNGFILLFKLFGNRSNILLFQNSKHKTQFKNKLVGDTQLELNQLHRPIQRSLKEYIQTPVYKLYYPTFDKNIAKYLTAVNFQSKTVSEQWELLQTLVHRLETGEFLIIETDTKPVFSLIPFDDWPLHKIGDDPIEAMNQFYVHFIKQHFLEVEKRRKISDLEKRLKQSENYIKKSRLKLESLENQTPPNQLADIIMANLHRIEPSASEVSLLNFYSNTPITIKLKKDLSAAKNAELLYRKSKNRIIEKETIEKNINSKQEEVSLLQTTIQELKQVASFKDLKSFSKQRAEGSRSKIQAPKPFKEFYIEGFKVWVGKNAKSNDELTLKNSFKEDLWLHVKDIPGSHVLLKHIAGKTFPSHIIEEAASLAAYYSKRKNDNHVPVIYTPAKYVRKRKGSPPGQVIVEREKVILVTPSSI